MRMFHLCLFSQHNSIILYLNKTWLDSSCLNGQVILLDNTSKGVYQINYFNFNFILTLIITLTLTLTLYLASFTIALLVFILSLYFKNGFRYHWRIHKKLCHCFHWSRQILKDYGLGFNTVGNIVFESFDELCPCVL